jgi:phospholipid/cholesterol/gamma-HCH transport system substrate-binding protein
MRRGGREMTAFKAGLIALVLIVVFSFFGFSRYNPFKHEYTLHATFQSANNLQVNSPVRIAGVNVGLVKEVTPLKDGSGMARVTMQIENKGLPIHRDAYAKIRPRIFLEGNFFVDLQPGTPSSPIAKSGYTIPVQQTAYPVQFGQLLTALQQDTRTDLQVFLHEYGTTALGNGGAQAYNQMLDNAPAAFKSSSIANQATLGQQPHDLSNLLRGQQRLFARLDADPTALKNLITNLNTTALAFARQDVALQQAIPKLRDVLSVGRPALASLNDALPHLRAFAVDALPSAKSSGPTIDASLPFIKQARGLVSKPELRGLAADLVPTIPALAKVNKSTIPLLDESRSLSACTSNVLVPFAKTPIPDPDFPDASGVPWYQQTGPGLVGVGGESRLSDGDTPFLHVQTNAGPTTVQFRNQNGESFFATTANPPVGVRPLLPDHRPVDRPNVPCETQQPPDMNAPLGPAEKSFTPSGPCSPTSDPISCIPLPRRTSVAQEWDSIKSYLSRKKQGLPAVDPIPYSQEAFQTLLKQAGLKVDTTGVEIPDLSLKNAAKR